MGAYLQKRLNISVLMFGGSIVCLVAILLGSLMNSWWGFVIFYGCLFPAGVGLIYWPPIICAWEWYPDNKGVVSGLIIGAFGMGAFIFGFITEEICNPWNDERFVDPVNGNEYFPRRVAE